MMASRWLIEDQERSSAVAIAIARLCGLKVHRLAFSDEVALAEPNAAASLVMISFDHLRHLSPATRSRLKRSVMQGAALHIKGDAAALPIPLAPFADGQLVTMPTVAAGYQFNDHPMLPAVLRNEKRSVGLSMLTAANPPVAAEPLLMAFCADGVERPAMFVMRLGRGAVIYDLSPDTADSSMSLLAMLEDPRTMPDAVGAFAAATISWKAPFAESQLNVVIDDRPVDFDYFNCARALAFLRHLEHNFADVHVDFGWTPDQTHPSHRYVAALKSFQSGFVWHGLLRHIDHRAITDLSAEYNTGRELVEEVEAAYGVRFQPVMIFPFERDTPQCIEFLEDKGFIGKAQTLAESTTAGNGVGATGTASLKPKAGTGQRRFAILERFPVRRLTRERLTARALLGLPIIAAAHPHDIGLIRLAGLRPRTRGSFSHFDPILRFAAEKQLHSASLEEIAERAIECG